MLDVEELRKVGTAVYLAAEKEVAEDIAKHIMDAADEVERLRFALRTVLGDADHGQKESWDERCRIGRAALT